MAKHVSTLLTQRKHRTAEALTKIHAFSERRWGKAVFHKHYPLVDDPLEDNFKPLKPVEAKQFLYACSWRKVTHFCEAELLKDVGVRTRLVDSHIMREDVAFYETGRRGDRHEE